MVKKNIKELLDFSIAEKITEIKEINIENLIEKIPVNTCIIKEDENKWIVKDLTEQPIQYPEVEASDLLLALDNYIENLKFKT